MDAKTHEPSCSPYGLSPRKCGIESTERRSKHDLPYNPGGSWVRLICLPPVSGAQQDCLYWNKRGKVEACYFQVRIGSYVAEDYPTYCKLLMGHGKIKRLIFDTGDTREVKPPETLRISNALLSVADEDVQHNLQEWSFTTIPTSWIPIPGN